MSDTLYIYLCSQCQTLAAAAVPMPRLNCALCLRFMSFKYTSPVETAGQRAIFRQGLMFNPFVDRKPKPCDTCKQPMAPAPEIVLQGVGEFCSAHCADVGVLRHERFMERIKADAEREHAALLEKFRPKHRPVLEKVS